MTVQTETGHAAGFLMSEANGNRSRENVTLVSGQNLKAGDVLGKITSGGKYSAYSETNSPAGVGTAKAVLLADCDASAGDTECVVIARDAEVNGNELLYSDTGSPAPVEADAIVDLAAVGIIVRS